ncbi:MAG: ACP S-malonyltransferase [Desulfuromonadales bacterium]|nr:ACP S-malonyltransferase [Desulfuromonadales bacterium]
MNCFMFPGQPMTVADIPAGDPVFDELARRCQDVTGYDPREHETSGLNLTESIRLQLFGTGMSLYRYGLLTGQHGPPDIITEHSMGIYPALAACGSVDSGSALELTGRIGVCLAAMGARHRYALGSVVGLTGDPLTSIAAHNGVSIANYNTSRHHLLSGDAEQIRSATVEAEAAGAFSVGVYSCDAPLHSPLIDEIADELRTIVAEYDFHEPHIPLLNHLDQKLLKRADIPRFLVEELCRPVFWEKTYRALRLAGASSFHEVGAGRALTKSNRWIDNEL